MGKTLTQRQADEFAGHLDLDLDRGICHACLSFVSFAIDRGDEREIAREVRRMTPGLWADGLADEVLPSARRAVMRGVPHAEEALADLETRGPRGIVARAAVRALAGELSQRARRDPWLKSLGRDRPRLVRPELN